MSPKLNAYSDWEALGQETFQHLAASAGLDVSDFSRTQQWLKDEPARFHIVQRYDSPVRDPLILKQVFRPDDPEEFAGIVAAQRLAGASLKGHQDMTAPHILAEDRALQACLMRYQPGETLRELCLTHEDHTPYLRAAGRWLAAYHAGGFQQERPFRPRFMAAHMLKLAGQMEAGERRIHGQKRFVRLAHQVQELVPDFAGRSSKVSAKHGDMNSNNILIDGNVVAGIDFMPVSHAPVGYDIARLLLHYALSAVDLDAIPKGHVIPPHAIGAFFDGYDFVGQDDPGVQFLLRIQILTDWNRNGEKKSAQTLIGFERLRAIARKAFA